MLAAVATHCAQAQYRWDVRKGCTLCHACSFCLGHTQLYTYTLQPRGKPLLAPRRRLPGDHSQAVHAQVHHAQPAAARLVAQHQVPELLEGGLAQYLPHHGRPRPDAASGRSLPRWTTRLLPRPLLPCAMLELPVQAGGREAGCLAR